MLPEVVEMRPCPVRAICVNSEAGYPERATISLILLHLWNWSHFTVIKAFIFIIALLLLACLTSHVINLKKNS